MVALFGLEDPAHVLGKTQIGDTRKRRVEDAGLAFVSFRNFSERLFGPLAVGDVHE